MTCGTINRAPPPPLPLFLHFLPLSLPPPPCRKDKGEERRRRQISQPTVASRPHRPHRLYLASAASLLRLSPPVPCDSPSVRCSVGGRRIEASKTQRTAAAHDGVSVVVGRKEVPRPLDVRQRGYFPPRLPSSLLDRSPPSPNADLPRPLPCPWSVATPTG